jgi:AAA15 family ATPase/GTPase
MIVSFSVSNFRSIREEVTLSLVASKRLSGGEYSHDDHAVPIPDSDERVLRTAVIYGANGAGKSNVFRALKYFSQLVLTARVRNTGTARQPFRFDGVTEATSTFDLRFIANDRLYRLFCRVDDTKIVEEYLVREERGRETVLYERITSEDGNVVIEAPGLRSEDKKLIALATVGGPQNQTFLATVRATLKEESMGELQGIINWLEGHLNLIAPDGSIAPVGRLLSSSEEFASFAGEFLRSAGTGVEHLAVQKKTLSEEELKGILPDSLFSKISAALVAAPRNTVMTLSKNGEEFLIEKDETNRYYSVTVQAAHLCKSGDVISFDLSEESDGTRRLLELIPALHQIEGDGEVFFIDEIDRSLHPILVWNFLKFFLSSCKGSRHQIIVTTHESILLDQELLRRDEIWFTEKDNELSTRLYSLAEFQVRKDLQLRKHYLSGRFGAIPFPGSLDHLPREMS